MKKVRWIVLVAILIVCRYVDAQKVETLVFDSGKNFEAINWLPDGRIFVADYQNGKLYKLAHTGEVETLVTGFSNIAGGGVDADGRFYFAGIGNGTVNRLNDDGSYDQVASGFNQPVGVLPVSGTSEILVSVYGENAVYNVDVANGEKKLVAQNGGINGPDGMVALDDGSFLVANFNNNRVHRVDADGAISLFAQLPVSGFAGYITKHEDVFYMPSIAGRKIYRISSEGMVTELAGSGENGNADGNFETASFSSPNGIAVNPEGDTILVSDGSRIRIITGFSEVVSSTRVSELVDVEVGPNPCVDYMILKHETLNMGGQYALYGTDGMLVKQDTLAVGDTSQVSVADLSPGVFTLVVRVGNDKASKVFRVVKVSD